MAKPDVLGDGKCRNCGKPLGQIFRRIRIDIGVIDVVGVQERIGLAMMLGGDAGLADVFASHPNDGLVKFTGEVDAAALITILVCLACSVERLDMGSLTELATEGTDGEA